MDIGVDEDAEALCGSIAHIKEALLAPKGEVIIRSYPAGKVGFFELIGDRPPASGDARHLGNLSEQGLEPQQAMDTSPGIGANPQIDQP